MDTKSYEAVPKEDVETEREDNTRSNSKADRDQRRPGSNRPYIYYGEGEFDPPSSDSEAEEEQLLEKGNSSAGAAERGLASTLPDDAAQGLVVGGKKVCRTQSIVSCSCY